jgi:hypothetical protein
MEDGIFQGERDSRTYHVGRAIFVFGGGRSSRLRDVEEQMTTGVNEWMKSEASKKFEAAKGPDFFSRVRGYIDIYGPDPDDPDDHYYIVRRAVILRSQLAKKFGIEQTWRETDEEIHISNEVLNAFLKVPKYKHSARSMRAIIDMSALSGRLDYLPSYLPAESQLNLHVDGGIFLKYSRGMD